MSRALWLRGILPLGKTECNEPYRTLPGVAGWMRVAEFFWDQDIYWTAGSVGHSGNQPNLRRCGVGISHVNEELQFTGGLFGALPSSTQTVPISEVYAMLAVILNHSDRAPITIVTDSEISERVFEKRPQGFDPWKPNADLWQWLWEALGPRANAVFVKWIKSHWDEGKIISNTNQTREM